MPKVFISHSSKDRRFIEDELLPLLEKHGIDTWFSSHRIPSAADWEKTIRAALRECDWFLVVLSPNAIVSEWVQAEVHWALDHRKDRFASVLVEDCTPSDLHLKLIRYQHIDYRSDPDAARRKLLALLSPSATRAEDPSDLPPTRQRGSLRRKVAVTAAALIVAAATGLLALARFGNPVLMPAPLVQLAVALRNPATVRDQVTPAWTQLCHAWDTWLGDLQANAPRLLRMQTLWAGSADPLRRALADFMADAGQLHPAALVPAAKGEKRMGVLGQTPPESVKAQLLDYRVVRPVEEASARVEDLAKKLENWPVWKQLREVQVSLESRGLTRAAHRLAVHLPAAPDSAGYRREPVRLLRLLNELSLDPFGTSALIDRARRLELLAKEMEASGDRVQMAMPALVLEKVGDVNALADLGEALRTCITELRRYRELFLDPSVDRVRFLNDSPLQWESTAITATDFLRWEAELAKYTRKQPNGGSR